MGCFVMERVALTLHTDSLQFLCCEPAGKQTPADHSLLNLEHFLFNLGQYAQEWEKVMTGDNCSGRSCPFLCEVRSERKKQINKCG